MVNETRDGHRVRSNIVTLLRSAEGPISGEYIAGELGLSRVAVWKHVQALSEHGYRITGTPRGYVLEAAPEDSLLPWDLRDANHRISHFEETDSTMNRALEAALAGAQNGSVYVAERQVAGRGTGDKAWESAQGGLFFTLLTRPSLGPAHYFRAVAAAQCALAEALRERGIEASVAWPNDLLVSGDDGTILSKAGGILCEHLSSGNAVRFLNLGVGVNTGNGPNLPGSTKVSLARRELLEAFLERFAARGPETAGLESRWAALSPHVGHEVRFKEGDTVHRGAFLGIDPYGNARIAPGPDINQVCRFQPGSITLLNKGKVS